MSFRGKRYNLFEPGTVDALFRYYNQSNLLWQHLRSLSLLTISDDRKKALDIAAKAAGKITSEQTGCVPTVVNENEMRCNLVFVRFPNQQSEELPKALPVSASQKGGATEKELLVPGKRLGDEPSKFVILTNTAKSVRVLGQQASLFAEYQRDLLKAKQVAKELVELEKQLLSDLKTLADKPEIFTL